MNFKNQIKISWFWKNSLMKARVKIVLMQTWATCVVYGHARTYGSRASCGGWSKLDRLGIPFSLIYGAPLLMKRIAHMFYNSSYSSNTMDALIKQQHEELKSKKQGISLQMRVPWTLILPNIICRIALFLHRTSHLGRKVCLIVVGLYYY